MPDDWEVGLMIRQLLWLTLFCPAIFHCNAQYLAAQSLTAVGSGGTILHSTDGGENWTPQQVGTGQDLNAVEFLDASTGFVAGHFEYIDTRRALTTIYSTANGGDSWRFAGFVTVQSNSLLIYDMQFVDANTGWFSAGGSNLWKTVDGGVSWSEQGFGGDGNYRAIDFIDENVGWAVGFTIVQTNNGGSMVSTQHREFSPLLGVDFVDSSTGWAVGSSGQLLNTTDGGANWNSQSYPFVDVASFRDVEFVDSDLGWIVGSNGTILHTNDGGLSWGQQASGTTMILEAVEFLDNNNGWAVGERGTILRTTDGGSSWQQQVSGTTLPLYDIVVVIPGPSGLVLATAALLMASCVLMRSRGTTLHAPRLH